MVILIVSSTVNNVYLVTVTENHFWHKTCFINRLENFIAIIHDKQENESNSLHIVYGFLLLSILKSNIQISMKINKK